jgi:pentatricopeptide repeat protein
LWNALLAGYCQNERVTDAHHLFDKMAKQDVVSWNTMIAGYAQSEHGEEALKLFLMMKRAGKIPNQSTYTSYLHACAGIAGFEQGKQVHAHILKIGFKSDVFVGNGLITMYAKCGSIGCADQLFREMPKRDVVSWTAMIFGYAQNGKGNEAVQLFEEMKMAGIKPNQITMTGVLSACSHVGLVDEGCHYFNSMSRDLSITPIADHHACIVDLLCRAGRLDEAEAFIKSMPFEPDMAVLASLLAACRAHVNVELGKWTAERMFELEPQNSTTYILLSNIYAAADRWDDVRNVRNMMKDTEVKKEPGCSWIEVKSKVHIFLAGDQSYPQSESIPC